MPDIERKLHDLGAGVFAYTQLPGSWGYSNSGLVTDGDQALLVDTLFDRSLTRDMLARMRDAAPAASNIGTLVNTHGNGDHCYGNAEVRGAEIVGTRGCVEDLLDAPASRNALLLRAAAAVETLGWAGRAVGAALNAVGVDRVMQLLDAAPLAMPLFSDFDFSHNPPVPPTRTFQGELTLSVGDKEVQLLEVGPAHTLGDAVVYVPSDRILFTGDIVFKDAHPILWEGPVENWIAACDRLCALDVNVVVPGHGPITTLDALRETRHYFEVLTRETRERYDAGLTAEQAAFDLALDEFAGWLDAERVYINVHSLYRQFRGSDEKVDVLAMFGGMGRLVRGDRRLA